jgi:Flp pilus assembly secretin CpaC
MRIARLCACALGLALLLAMLPIARASDEAITHPSTDPITLGLGGGSVLTLERSFDTILVGNPDVVEVQPRDNRTVVLKALGIGASNVIFLDEQSIAIANVRVIVSDAHT